MTHIPSNLLLPFLMFMHESGYGASYKKGFTVFKRGNEVAKISTTETDKGFAMNEVCQKKFCSFCRAWLNRDKHFVSQLRMRGMALMNKLSYQMVA